MVEVGKIQAQGSNRRLTVEANITTGQQTKQRIGNTYTRYKNPVCGKNTGENRKVTRIITTPRRSGTQKKGERMGIKKRGIAPLLSSSAKDTTAL